MDFVQYTMRAKQMFGHFVMNQNKLKAEVFNLDPLDYLESQYTPHCLYMHHGVVREDLCCDNPYHVVNVSNKTKTS